MSSGQNPVTLPSHGVLSVFAVIGAAGGAGVRLALVRRCPARAWHRRRIARSGLSVLRGIAGHSSKGTNAYRPAVRAYIVVRDTPAAFGIVNANPRWGAGGYPQVFVPTWRSDLQPVFDIPLTNTVPFP